MARFVQELLRIFEKHKARAARTVRLSGALAAAGCRCLQAIVPGYENKQQPVCKDEEGSLRVEPSRANPRLYLEDEEVPPLPTDALADDVLFPSNLPAFKSRL